MTNPAYQRGYRAGKKHNQATIQDLQSQLREARLDSITMQRERVFLRCLDLVLRRCKNWAFGKDSINSAEGYCRLAKIFADHSIKEINK